MLLLVAMSASAQNYELGAGSVINTDDKDYHANYYIEANFIIKTNQNRKYLNNLLFGFTHSAFMTGNMSRGNDLSTSEGLSNDCNCDSNLIDFKSDNKYILKKEARGISLNFGISITDRWYLLSGVTNYQHIILINSEKAVEYRTMQIDAGVKYFHKIQKSYVTTTLKFNPETVSFGLGYSR